MRIESLSRRAALRAPRTLRRRLATAAPLAVLVVPALVAAGCGSSILQPASSPDEAQVRELQERILELQRRAVVHQVELARLRERVAELEARDGSAGAGRRIPSAARPASAEPPSASRAAAGTPLRDQPGLEVTEILEEDDIAGEEPDAPAAPLPGTARAAADRAAERAAATASLPPPTAAARAQYDRAYTLYHQGRLVDAEAAFRRYLQEHPDNDHADNAQYWIGEARYSGGDYRGALAAFRETVERYPGGNKVPDALLKAGQCLEELGDPEGARETYREIVRRFGDSAAAAVAEERLGVL